MNYSATIKNLKVAIQRGDFGLAISQFEAIDLDAVANEHEHQELLYLGAVACRQKGLLDQARLLANKLLDRNPDHARAYQELGYIHSAQHQGIASAKAFYEATRRNPALLSAWRALVPLYKSQENQDAYTIAKQQVDYLSALPREILGARDLLHEGQMGLADQVCRKFLSVNKHHVEGMLLLAEIGIQSKVYSEAEFLLESSNQLHPKHVPTAVEYLKLMSKIGKFKAAKDCAERLLTQQSDNPIFLTAKATAMVGLGELDDAIKLYTRLLEEDAQRANLWLLLGHALKAKGEFSDAVSAYQRAYDIQPDFGDAYWSLANTKTYRFNDTEVSNMQMLAEDSNVSVDNKIHLLFALGKSYEDAKDYQVSFDNYAKGNQLKQAQLQYHPEYIERQVSAQIEQLKKPLFDRFAKSPAGDPSFDPIFIVGMPRAGSTLLEQILASHSQVDGTMELHNILGLVARLRGHSTGYPALLSEIDPIYFKKFGEQYLNETRVYRKNAPLFIDKMPNNFVHIGLVKLILPNAKIIDARRNPMACCFSGFKQLFGEGQEFSYSLENIARYYTAYIKLMNHWSEVLPGTVLRVQHEDVINDLSGEIARILDFCGLPFEQQCIDFHRTKRAIKTPSSEQVRQPIYRSGMDQWMNYEEYLSPLKSIVGHLP